MSQRPGMRNGGARQGPYGPNNAPPPPSAPPPRDLESQGLDEVEIQRMGGRRRPSLAVRRRDYAQAEDLRERGQERFCSRSPVRPMGRRDDQNRVGDRLRYRVRSPLRHESLDVQRQRDDRKDEKQESIRCFACNETGHRAADCKVAKNFGRRACFRCGDPGHIARNCKVRNGQIKTDAEVAADKLDTELDGYYNSDRSGHEGWSPSQEATIDDHVYANTRQQPQKRSSAASSRLGYYVEDEVDWGDDGDEALEDQYEQPYQRRVDRQDHTAVARSTSVKPAHPDSNWNPDRLKMARESKLGLPHLQNAKVDDVPPTVYDLRGYDHRIFTIYSSKPKHQRFINGANGKVAPGAYGSEQRHDLGLCFATFLTRKRCEMGVACPWRHHPLSNAERAWVVEYGKSKGKDFIGYMDRWWAFPEVPVPGATMYGVGDDS